MNTIPDSPTRLATLKSFTSGIVLSCFGWLPCFQRRHLVHPVNTDLGSNVFLELSSHRRIHAIHIAPNRKTISSNENDSQKHAFKFTFNENAGEPFRTNGIKERSQPVVSSVSPESSVEDYWFTRWSRPLKVSDNCNCSFRRNWRKSLRESKKKRALVSQSKDQVYYDSTNDNLNLSTLCSSNVKTLSQNTLTSFHVETFAETFIDDILEEAVSCLLIRKCSYIQPFDSNNMCTGGENIIKANGVSTIASNKCTSYKEINHSSSPSCSSSFNSAENNTQTLTSDKEVKSPKVYSQRTDGDNNPNMSSGCVNPSFLVSATDPVASADIKVPPTKMCKHVKRTMKPLLYFLHGVGSSADIWWGLLHYFVAAGFEVLAPDMLGHGFSASPDHASAYTFQRLLTDAVDMFDRFVGEHGKCVVIGHAYGCSLAAAVARHRTQVTHLVLISGGGPTPLAPAHLPSTFPCLQGCLKPFISCGFKRDVLYAPCGKHMAPCEALSDGVSQYVLRHVAQGQDWPEGDSTFHRRILVPTLLVHGMHDPHVTLVQECEMERTIPRSFLEIIPNAGHLAMLETPGQLSHMVHCFIDWWSR